MKLWRRTQAIAVLALYLLCFSSLAQAQTPQATAIGGKVYDIRKTWTIGGEGNWDYLTLDPSTLQLYIAHGHVVQVVDVDAGAVAGEVTGLSDAHGIALDDHGQYGYVSDGPANDVKIFDRKTLEVVATVPTGKNPRAVVFDSSNRLVFAICPDPAPESKIPRRNGQRASDSSLRSTITIIDADTQAPVADILVPGRLGFAQSDGKGRIYVNITDRNQIAYFNVQAIESRLHRRVSANAAENSNSDGTKSQATTSPIPSLDWSDNSTPLHLFALGQNCQSPRGLAVDGANQRIFAACDNMKMVVLNANDGQIVAELPIGAGTDAIGYDPDRGLIYTSNGGGVGSLTIIRRDVTDSYNVIEELPTQARARTLAVNPVSGEVYLVTNVSGFDLTHPGGIGDLKAAAVTGSFHVLVVGN